MITRISTISTHTLQATSPFTLLAAQIFTDVNIMSASIYIVVASIFLVYSVFVRNYNKIKVSTLKALSIIMFSAIVGASVFVIVVVERLLSPGVAILLSIVINLFGYEIYMQFNKNTLLTKVIDKIISKI